MSDGLLQSHDVGHLLCVSLHTAFFGGHVVPVHVSLVMQLITFLQLLFYSVF